jgi:YesN/AraC family two-component response regulator
MMHPRRYAATAFYDAETALAECDGKCPEFVISDVIMPKISGVEMAIQIKERYPACKILLFSINVLSESHQEQTFEM